MAVFTWRRSGDPIIDWGREVFAAWYVSEGWGVPQDVSQLFGPLPYHVNGLLLRLFGTSITTLLAANLAVLGVAAVCVWKIAARIFHRSIASLALLAFLFLSGFPHLTLDGNYNFLTPYSHGATHGVTLGLVLLVVLTSARQPRSESRRWVVAGVLCGLALLTKPEIGIATMATLVVALAIPAPGGLRSPLPGFALALAGASLPIALSLSGVFSGLTGRAAFSAIVAPYRSALLPAARRSPYYLRGMGLDMPVTHVAVGIGLLLALGLLAAVLIRVRGQLGGIGLRRRRRVTSIVLGLGLPALMLVTFRAAPFAWLWLGRSLGPGVLLLLLGFCVPVLRRGPGKSSNQYERARSLAILCTLALGMLLKLGLWPRFHHYGFALAAPAVLAAVGGLTWIAPAAIRRGFGRTPGILALGRGLVLYVIAMSALTSLVVYGSRNTPLAEGADRIYLLDPARDARTDPFLRTYKFLETRVERDTRLRVLPEGSLLNYLLRARPALDIASLMPLELGVLGTEEIVERMASESPELLVLVESDLEAYGLARFPPGDSIYAPLVGWIEASYCPERAFRSPGNPSPAILVLARCPRSAPAQSPNPGR